MHADDAAQHRAAFERWRAADPRHAAAYERLEWQWTTAGLLDQTAIGRTRALPEPRSIFSSRTHAYALALTAILAVVGISFWMISVGGTNDRSTMADIRIGRSGLRPCASPSFCRTGSGSCGAGDRASCGIRIGLCGGLGRDAGGDAAAAERGAKPVAVIALVTKQDLGRGQLKNSRTAPL